MSRHQQCTSMLRRVPLRSDCPGGRAGRCVSAGRSMTKRACGSQLWPLAFMGFGRLGRWLRNLGHSRNGSWPRMSLAPVWSRQLLLALALALALRLGPWVQRHQRHQRRVQRPRRSLLALRSRAAPAEATARRTHGRGGQQRAAFLERQRLRIAVLGDARVALLVGDVRTVAAVEHLDVVDAEILDDAVGIGDLLGLDDLDGALAV